MEAKCVRVHGPLRGQISTKKSPCVQSLRPARQKLGPILRCLSSETVRSAQVDAPDAAREGFRHAQAGPIVGLAGEPSQLVPGGSVSPFIRTDRSPSCASSSITES